MSSKKSCLGRRRLRTISARTDDSECGETDEGLIDELFGVCSIGNNKEIRKNEFGFKVGFSKKKVKKTILDIPDPILENIFKYLHESDLKTLRCVNKKVCDVATTIFRTCHLPILIDSEAEVNRFRILIEATVNFPFSRFRLVLQQMPRHLLIKFINRYEEHIKYLKIEPFEKNGGGGFEQMLKPMQRPIMKLTAIIQELIDIEELHIVFPSLSNFDYNTLEFEKSYEFESLKVITISFAANGFCRFSSDLAISILEHTDNLSNLRLKLPEPSYGTHEAWELKRVLKKADDVCVNRIEITLVIISNVNSLLYTISEAIIDGSQIRKLTLVIGRGCEEYRGIAGMLRSASKTLWSLIIFKSIHKGNSLKHSYDSRGFLRLPYMEALRMLDVDSYHISIAPIKMNQFPNLRQLSLHLKYGDDKFYLKSILHPLEKLKLHFHEMSIIRILPPDFLMDNLMSARLRKLELVNPPPGHLAFMFAWGHSIETLIISVTIEDPTYPTNQLIGQLIGNMQLRDTTYNHVGQLYNLKKLCLLFPIDEWMAKYLWDLDKLWELIVDDSLVTKQTIHRMKLQHNIYISLCPSKINGNSYRSVNI